MTFATIRLLLVLLCAFACLPALAKRLDIEPGPTSMTAEEQSIQADPARQMEHGVVLVEETNWNEALPGNKEIEYHLRAKILSSDGRGLADVVIPHNMARGKLRRWWGRTILPDGRVLELREEDLERSAEVEGRFFSFEVLKGALPGVVPGAIIDYGYEIVVIQDELELDRWVPLQRNWPVARFEYRWKPYDGYPATLIVSRAEGLQLATDRKGNWISLSAADIPPVVDEPYMPPDSTVRAAVTLYYHEHGPMKAGTYWKKLSNIWDRDTRDFIARSKAIKEALPHLGVPDAGSTEEKLKTVYDWIAANIRNEILMTAEEREMAAREDQRTRDRAAWVLAHRVASPRQLDQLFIGFARALGVEANLVLATDRTERLWNEALLTDQFDTTLVAVELPGREEELIVDPGSGLPFGQIPWNVSGAKAMLATKKGPKTIVLRSSKAKQNQAFSKARIEFTDDNESMMIDWELSGTGQCGYAERRYLRYIAPDDREEHLYKRCGESSDVEVLSAETPDLSDPSKPYRLICSTEAFDTSLDDDTSRYQLFVRGVYVPPIPDLTAEERVHPVVLRYPRIDVTELEVMSPHGFGPADVPSDKRVESPYGDYELTFERTEQGFQVKRRFELLGLSIRAENYGSFREYLKEVRRADQSSVEFVRQDGGSGEGD